MGGASRKHSGHRPQRANHPEPIQARHSATPLETPPRRAGKSLLLNHKPAHSTDDAVKMQKFASRYRKNWIVVENGSSEHRTTFPASRAKYDLNRAVCKPNDWEWRRTSMKGLATYPSSFLLRQSVAQRIGARLYVFSRAFTANRTYKRSQLTSV